MAILAKAKLDQKVMPISLVEDVLCLQIPGQEKIKLLDVVDCRNKLALEDFLLSGLSHWDQDLAALALRKWVASTDHLLWHRLLPLTVATHVTQRVQYTILDQCSPYCGTSLVVAFQRRPGLDDLSPAFHALIFQRSAQRNLPSQELDRLAKKYVDELKQVHHEENKAIPAAIGWLVRYDPGYIRTQLLAPGVSEIWREVMRSMYVTPTTARKAVDPLVKALSSKSKSKSLDVVVEAWPSLWTRNYLDSATIAKAISLLIAGGEAADGCLRAEDALWKYFAGADVSALIEAMALIDDEQMFAKSVNALSSLMDIPFDRSFLNLVLDRLSQSASPGAFLELLVLRLRLEITSANSASESIYDQIIIEERRAVLHDDFSNPLAFVEDPSEWVGLQPDLKGRKHFFALAYRKIKAAPGQAGDYWGRLAEQWLDPKESSLKELSSLARQTPELFKLCYIQTLGRYHGQDGAALKLLDFIRTTEESEMYAVIHSLAGIATPRCYQELISCMTRPNVSLALKFEICLRLKEADLRNLQSELRSAISDLNPFSQESTEVAEIIDSLSSLLTPRAEGMTEPVAPNVAGDKGGRNLDLVLAGKIPHYNELSSEVKRALRTAQFFHDQINGAKAVETIDLSPVIDMQYKALELLFRESFEESCSAVINEGVLQRKLDVIGYARPIPQAMDEFEKYIGLIPVIETIPYFSKFKLRKMLRAICQYRPGKRFTLDGIKAFALFFLCFGRKDCRYGLENLIDLGFASDQALCEFGKELHIFQDFRNRAAHEGFHPDAHNDINGIWRATAEIIQNAFRIRQVFKPTAKVGHFGAGRREPVIERKEPRQRAS